MTRTPIESRPEKTKHFPLVRAILSPFSARICLPSILATLLAFSSKASAYEPVFGDAGHLAVSVERLSGVSHTSVTISAPGGDTKFSSDTVTLFGNAVGTATGYGWPRLALDFFVARHFSVGGAVSIFVYSPSSDSLTGVLIAPRVGYAAALTSRVGIWPRAGFTYVRTALNRDAALGFDSAASFYALTLEVPVAIMLAPRIGLLVGPTIELGLGGSSSTTGAGVTTSVSAKATDYGINAGLLLYF